MMAIEIPQHQPGQVATDAELQNLKVARPHRDVCGFRRQEPAHRHFPLADGILSRFLPQCIHSQPVPAGEIISNLCRIPLCLAWNQAFLTKL